MDVVLQPDFSALFRRTTIAPLRFRVRDKGNFVHDVHFLSGYLHDARFTPDKVIKRGRKLSIELQRDCWEFGFTEHVRSVELHVAKSRFSITPVSKIRWEVADVKRLKQELWIESVYIGAAHWETSEASELVISAPHAGWKLCISIAVHFGDIRLDDLETPYLYSTRKG